MERLITRNDYFDNFKVKLFFYKVLWNGTFLRDRISLFTLGWKQFNLLFFLLETFTIFTQVIQTYVFKPIEKRNKKMFLNILIIDNE